MGTMKSSTLWAVNVISFTLFVVLAGTGLLDWLVLPRGYNARSGLLWSPCGISASLYMNGRPLHS